jgi:hypothetical protein
MNPLLNRPPWLQAQVVHFANHYRSQSGTRDTLSSVARRSKHCFSMRPVVAAMTPKERNMSYCAIVVDIFAYITFWCAMVNIANEIYQSGSSWARALHQESVAIPAAFFELAVSTHGKQLSQSEIYSVHYQMETGIYLPSCSMSMSSA